MCLAAEKSSLQLQVSAEGNVGCCRSITVIFRGPWLSQKHFIYLQGAHGCRVSSKTLEVVLCAQAQQSST